MISDDAVRDADSRGGCADRTKRFDRHEKKAALSAAFQFGLRTCSARRVSGRLSDLYTSRSRHTLMTEAKTASLTGCEQAGENRSAVNASPGNS